MDALSTSISLVHIIKNIRGRRYTMMALRVCSMKVLLTLKIVRKQKMSSSISQEALGVGVNIRATAPIGRISMKTILKRRRTLNILIILVLTSYNGRNI
ncbi:hypothetical protein ES703_83257 [subsurface metagenome]